MCTGRRKHLHGRTADAYVRAYGPVYGDGHWSDRLVIRSVLVNAQGAQPPPYTVTYLKGRRPPAGGVVNPVERGRVPVGFIFVCPFVYNITSQCKVRAG